MLVFSDGYYLHMIVYMYCDQQRPRNQNIKRHRVYYTD